MRRLQVASETPLSALYMGKLACEAGIPPGVLNIIVGKGSVVGMALAKHPSIDKVRALHCCSRSRYVSLCGLVRPPQLHDVSGGETCGAYMHQTL